MTIHNLATREGWLESSVEAMRGWLDEIGHPLPERVRISVGWPKAARGKHVVGQAWSPDNSTDSIGQIFVSPDRGGDETVAILATVLHEMIHLAVGVQEGHKGSFITAARAVGFKAAWTSSSNQTEELTERLAGVAERIGEIPHGALSVGEKTAAQKAYQLKVSCVFCGYIVRTTRKMIDRGLPTCPDVSCERHGEDMEVEEKEPKDG